jgi:hypothetical protein
MSKLRTLISTAAVAIALTLPTVFVADQAAALNITIHPIPAPEHGGGHGWGGYGGYGGYRGWGGGYGYIGYGGYGCDHPHCIIGLPCHWRFSEY